MARFIQKLGHQKANLYATISTLVGVITLLIAIGGYIWYDAKYKSDTANDIKNIKVSVYGLDSAVKTMSVQFSNYEGELTKLRTNDQTLDIKKQDKKSIKPSDLPLSFINLGPVRDTSINYLITLK